MRWIIPVAAIFLAGCQSEGEKAEAEYRIARSSGVDSAQACEFERRIERAYLRDEDKERYQRWRVAANISCNQAALDRLM